MAKAYIGTSGFSYLHWGDGIFYPKDLPQRKWFEYYCQHFKSVELNVSFYRLPKKEVFAGWRKKAGPDFVFAVKGSRFITHIKRLKDCQEPVERFFEAADELHPRGGVAPAAHPGGVLREVVLWQLPPRFKANPERLELFLKILPKTWRHALEFRSSTWLTVKVYELIRRFNAAVVFQDYPEWPISQEITADFVYLRFHGKTSLYSSCYTEKELKEWAEKIRNWQNKGLDVYAYFNNDALGYAVPNAKELKKLVIGN